MTSILLFVALHWVCSKGNGGKQSRGFAFSQKSNYIEMSQTRKTTSSAVAAKSNPPESYSNSITLTFENVSFTTQPTRSNPKGTTIVQDLTGAFLPGTMTALMGPSGAGKSTMLDVLALRKKNGAITGRICANGKIANKTMMKKISSYVLQHDCLVEELTVRETLMFAANMQMPGSSTAAERKQRVASVIEELGLMHVRTLRLGEPYTGIVVESVGASVLVFNWFPPTTTFLRRTDVWSDAHTAFEVFYPSAIGRCRENHCVYHSSAFRKTI